MQSFIDLPLSLKAAIGGAIILILLLVLVRQRKAEAGSAPAREKTAKAQKAERTPKTPKAKKAKAEKPARAKRSKDKTPKEKAPKEKRERRRGRRKDDAPEAEPVPAPVAQPALPAAQPVAVPDPVAAAAPLAPQPGWPTPGEMAIDPLPAVDAQPVMYTTPEAVPAMDPAVAPVPDAVVDETWAEAQPTDPTWTDAAPTAYDAPVDPTWADPGEAVYEPSAYEPPLDPAWAMAPDDQPAEASWAEPAQVAYDAPVDQTWAPADDQAWVDPNQAVYETPADGTWAEPATAYEDAADATWAEPDQPYEASADATWAEPDQQGYDAAADPAWAETAGATEDAVPADGTFDPATGWTTDTTWAPADEQDATGFAAASTDGWSSPEGEEAPQAETGWDSEWTTDEANADGWDDQPTMDAAPETVEPTSQAEIEPSVETAAPADDLDWSALGTIDADVPATPWTEDEADVDPSGEALWEPVEEVAGDEIAVNGTAQDAAFDAGSPASWDTTDAWAVESQHLNGSAGPVPVADEAEDTHVGLNGSSAGSIDDIASAIRPLEGDESSVVIDLAKVLDTGAPVELVIEQSDDGNGIRLRVERRDAESPVDDVPAAITEVEADEPVAGITAPEVVADSSDVAPAPPVNGVNGHADDVPAPVKPEPVAATVLSTPAADSAASVDPRTGSGDQDPSRILADIRARLAALDARRTGDA